MLEIENIHDFLDGSKGKSASRHSSSSTDRMGGLLKQPVLEKEEDEGQCCDLYKK